jgi:predicted transcriptional regulator
MCQNHIVVTGRQIRAAKAMLRLSTRELAALAQVSLSSIVKAEAADDVPGMHTLTLRKIQAALESAGIEFGTDGVSVRLRRQP